MLKQTSAGADRAVEPRATRYQNQGYILPKDLDEKSRGCNLDRIGRELTPLDPEQGGL